MRYRIPLESVDSGDGSFDWSPIKINKNAVKIVQVQSTEYNLNSLYFLLLTLGAHAHEGYGT